MSGTGPGLPSGGPGGAGAEATFEELLAQLEDITAKLAAGDLGIEAATDLYERAERLHALATERLNQVRARPANAPPDSPVCPHPSFGDT